MYKYIKENSRTYSPYYIVHNKIRVVRRQVTNRRNSTRLARLLTAHKNKSHKGVPNRQNSTSSLENKKVVEPYMKTVYGTIPENNAGVTVSDEPDETQPLLK